MIIILTISLFSLLLHSRLLCSAPAPSPAAHATAILTEEASAQHRLLPALMDLSAQQDARRRPPTIRGASSPRPSCRHVSLCPDDIITSGCERADAITSNYRQEQTASFNKPPPPLLHDLSGKSRRFGWKET
ncbi:unnamed protein product [Pleuronectes platessa]|uniref:Uncharacterized protein n=1 Tax=Pleuronectes platessa TaxID=8262 RepID=A0A9N7UY77_PLEPL|nr:unnamed protein product [Pleuronectes platessa]